MGKIKNAMQKACNRGIELDPPIIFLEKCIDIILVVEYNLY